MLSSHPLLLVMDATHVGKSFRALMVAVAYRGQTLPLAWRAFEGHSGNVPANDQIQLLEQVYAHIPSGVEVCLVGDAAFRSGDLHWAAGYDRPWILVSSSSDPALVLRLYRRRAWIETMFRDMKTCGFDLEATRLAYRRRIEWLLLGIVIAYLWLVILGSWVVKNGYRHEIDRRDRRDKSYFRLGWDWVARCIRLGRPIRVHFSFSF